MEIIKSEQEYNLFDWFRKVVIENYANFNGRARRSEYWYFVLAQFILNFGFIFLGGALIGFLELEFLAPIYSILIFAILLLLFIPSLAVAVRRLHDTGKSGWFLLLSIIPFGGIVLFIFYIQDSDLGTNQWGPNPKEVH